MTVSRIYQSAVLNSGASLRLDEKASHHLGRVLRASVGEKLIIFNGQGGEYDALITHIDKKGVDVEIQGFRDRDLEPPIDIILAQGIARGEKMDFIIQKAVELGVRKIIPLITERCNVRLDNEREEKRLQHWQSVIISACEQSGRNRLPEVAAPVDWKQWLPKAKADVCFVLSPHVDDKLPALTLKPGMSVMVVIGPEGGLSEPEVAMARQQGFAPLNLGPRVLRTETAALAALAVLQVKYGDFI